MAAQSLLNKLLRHAVRQLGCTPRTRQRLDFDERLGSGRQADARQFVLRVACEVGDVSRMVCGKAERADLVSESQAPKMLHRAGLCGIGLRVEGGVRFGIDDQTMDAAAAQFIRKHQTTGAGTND